MDLILDAPRAVGPIQIGMPFADAERILHSLPGYLRPPPNSRVNLGFADFETGLSVSVGRGRDGSVESVEVYRPSRDVTVLCLGIPVFDSPADQVISRLSSVTSVRVEDDGLRVFAAELSLSLWRSVLPEYPEDEDGRYFDAALVASKNYYDLPLASESGDTSKDGPTAEDEDNGQPTLF